MSFIRSLRAKTVLSALLPTALVLAGVAIIALYAYEQVARDVVQQRDTELARVSAARLSEGLSVYSLRLQNIAAGDDVRSMEPARVGSALVNAGGGLNVFDAGVLVYDSDGNALRSTTFAEHRSGTAFPVPSELDKVRKTLRPAFSNIFLDDVSGEDVILVAVPILGDSNEFKGLLAGVASVGSSLLNVTYAQVLELTAGGDGFAYLVDGNGRVIYHRDTSRLGQDYSTTEAVRRVTAGETDAAITKEPSGESVISGFAPVPNTAWGVVTQEDWSNVVGPIRDRSRLLIALLVAGGLLSGVLIFFALGRILKPINDLRRGAQRIASGDFDYTIAARTGDEIEALAQQFNTMASTLKESYTELEQRVTARTAALRESEEQIRSVVTGAPIVLFALDKEGVFTLSEGQALKGLGFKPGELVGQSVFDLFGHHPQIPEDIRRAMAGEEFTSTVQVYTMTYEIRYSPLRDEGGNVVGLIGVATDMTERRRAEEALRASEEKYRELFDRSNDAIFITSRDANIIDVNPSTLELFGYTRDEAMHLNVLDVYHRAEDRARFQEEIERNGSVRDFEVRIRKKDGTVMDCLVDATVRSDNDGTVLGYEGLIRDITERKRAEEALQLYADELARSNADLQQFAYVASHDLQEPLRMVAGYTQLLARRYRDRLDADADEFIGYAVDGAVRMQNLINDLLAYSRVGNRGQPLEATDCNAVFDEVVANLRTAMDDSQATVARDALPTVRADKSQLVELFQNLISNAIKFHGEEPPRIHVSAGLKENGWVFSVRDNGIGIDSEYAERIFGIFQRLHTRDQYPGTGIGLAICKRIVESRGGQIWVESQPGEGSIFHFTILMTEDNQP